MFIAFALLIGRWLNAYVSNHAHAWQLFNTPTLPKVVEITNTSFLDSVKNKQALRQAIVNYAMKFLGTAYVFAGTDSCGFDCSGFTQFVYGHFNIKIAHEADLQDTVGYYIPISDVQKADLLIFTGTDANIRTPGHVGIVISKLGELPIQFIHASSAGGVKISIIEPNHYGKRFLQARKVIY